MHLLSTDGMHPWFTRAEKPRILAHRGLLTPEAAASGVVENSFAAVAAAHSIGVLYVESDCHLTSDGVAILFHDDDLSRVAQDPRRVAEVPSVELAEIMAERGGLITLEQALEAFPTLRFNLDVKAEDAASEVGRLIAPHGGRVLVTSFSDARRRAALNSAHSTSADEPPATSAGRGTILRLLIALALHSRSLVARALSGLDALQIPERYGALRIVTPRLIDAAHHNDVEVHVWTVNDPADMTRLVEMGIDGIVTDRADVALATFHGPSGHPRR